MTGFLTYCTFTTTKYMIEMRRIHVMLAIKQTLSNMSEISVQVIVFLSMEDISILSESDDSSNLVFLQLTEHIFARI